MPTTRLDTGCSACYPQGSAMSRRHWLTGCLGLKRPMLTPVLDDHLGAEKLVLPYANLGTQDIHQVSDFLASSHSKGWRRRKKNSETFQNPQPLVLSQIAGTNGRRIAVQTLSFLSLVVLFSPGKTLQNYQGFLFGRRMRKNPGKKEQEKRAF